MALAEALRTAVACHGRADVPTRPRIIAKSVGTIQFRALSRRCRGVRRSGPENPNPVVFPRQTCPENLGCRGRSSHCTDGEYSHRPRFSGLYFHPVHFGWCGRNHCEPNPSSLFTFATHSTRRHPHCPPATLLQSSTSSGVARDKSRCTKTPLSRIVRSRRLWWIGSKPVDASLSPSIIWCIKPVVSNISCDCT